MNSKIEEIIKPVVVKFVKSLNGFYSKHCSDDMLVAVIMYKMNQEIVDEYNFMLHAHKEDNPSIEKAISISLISPNCSYDAVCWLFETVLEHGCKAGGNGHHVAQKFVSVIEELVDTLGD